jgi:hypothetical protein
MNMKRRISQQTAGQQVFVPPALRSVDHKKLRAMAKTGQLSAPEKMRLLKSMPTASPLIKSTNVWKPVLRLTPRNSWVSTPAVKAYWYFNEVVFFTPQWWDDDGVALFSGPLENGTQMVLRFSRRADQPNQAYAVDVTLGIGLAGDEGTNTYRVVCVVDGTPLPAKKIELKTAPRRHDHLLFDLAPSKSGEYMVTISMIPNTTTDPHSWWYFSSLEVGIVE